MTSASALAFSPARSRSVSVGVPAHVVNDGLVHHAHRLGANADT
ncbi:hypothetical protein [Myxococcus stipitatus]